MKRFLLSLGLAAAFSVAALAVEPGERLADPALEARARAIGKELRCLVCQNESIDESGADLAHDIRVLLRERLSAGDSDSQAMQFIVDRYGQFVLLKPPVEPATYALWFAAPVLLLIAGTGTALFLHRRKAVMDKGTSPLSESERERLARILREDGP